MGYIAGYLFDVCIDTGNGQYRLNYNYRTGIHQWLWIYLLTRQQKQADYCLLPLIKLNLLDVAKLTVVDGGFAGDQFQVFDNGTSLGFTSNPANNYPTSVATDFDAALVNPLYSSAVFYLAAGQHDITGFLSASATVNSIPLNATVGAVSLSSVPEPSTFGLLLAGSGLISIGVFSRRRAN